MKRLFKLLIPLSVIALAGCVVAPGRGYYNHPYYHSYAAVVVPAPVVVVRP
jgi:hypothetical protein